MPLWNRRNWSTLRKPALVWFSWFLPCNTPVCNQDWEITETPPSSDLWHIICFRTIFEPPHDKTKKCMCAQRRLISAWASTQSDQSLCCTQEESLGPELPIERTAKTDQIERMPRLIWVFTGHTVILSWSSLFHFVLFSKIYGSVNHLFAVLAEFQFVSFQQPEHSKPTLMFQYFQLQ